MTILINERFSDGSGCKESSCTVEDPGSNSGSRRPRGEGNCHSLQYSCLENSIKKELDTTEQLKLSLFWIFYFQVSLSVTYYSSTNSRVYNIFPQSNNELHKRKKKCNCCNVFMCFIVSYSVLKNAISNDKISGSRIRNEAPRKIQFEKSNEAKDIQKYRYHQNC